MDKNSTGTTVLNENWIVFQTSQGVEVRASLVRMTRHLAVLEMYTPSVVLQVSEVLNDFKIYASEQPVYSGRAVVQSLIYTGTSLVCEATLEDSWLEIDLSSVAPMGEKLPIAFNTFLAAIQKEFRILPEVKIAVADLQTFLVNLRIWMEQVELGIRSQPQGDRSAFERQILQHLQPEVLPKLAGLFEGFEAAFAKVDPDLRAAHAVYLKRQLHPLVLCAPFMYRTFKKPLGYAGDYEMVNMMVRDPYEGSSLFAKMLNTFFLNTPPVVAHRNRIVYLKDQLLKETCRENGHASRIYNLGCGPAQEVQGFLFDTPASQKAEFTLVDFNQETLDYTQAALHRVMTKSGRSTSIQLVKKSVAQLLKDAMKPGSKLLAQYDFVYCAGLFDYLPDFICAKLMDLFYEMLVPGGLLLVTNVDPSNPCQSWMEYSVDWHLIYRNQQIFSRLLPKKASPENAKIHSEVSGVNIFMELRKPLHG